ncbi:hypothetical protein Nepgr_018127 [Nepenthes gracilis]|uniref:Uncharacterized protein n=1 Tax=Nepenthes gracilis TaxID=150966 RepID=A0AAD3ST57_NEPGR|nr:hypothetical protein Nepgr_018127 [Nepenthes gracilis]
MDTWLWISDLSSTAEWDESNSPLIYQLASSNSAAGPRNQSMQLKAERRFMSSTETAITFSVEVEGFQPPQTAKKTLWLSDECPPSSDKRFLPLVLQLIREIIDRSPIGHNSVGARSKLEQLKREPIARMLETQSPESFSKFFNLIFLVRLFWLCACDAATEFGCLYFNSLLVLGIEQLSRDMRMPVLRTFLLSVGVYFELCVARAVGYISAKCLILKEMSAGLQLLTPSASNLGISYVTQAHGLWVLKGYVPVQSMRCTRHNVPNDPFRIVDAKEAALRYVLAHQHLEAVVQFEYLVVFYDRYIQVSARIDNIRLHVVKLGFSSNDNMDYDGEVCFPPRIQVWVGPEIGSTCIAALCMRQLTANTDRYIKMRKSIKSSFNDKTTPRINVTEKRIKMKDWKLDLNSEGNVAIYDFFFLR